MGKNGDLTALETLGNRKLRAANGKNALKYYWLSAERGSTGVLFNIATLLASQPDYKGDTEYAKLKLIQALSIYKLSELRGDIQTSQVGEKNLISDYKRYFGSSKFSQLETDNVNELSHMYNYELTTKRHSNDLNDFKNLTPKFISEPIFSE